MKNSDYKNIAIEAALLGGAVLKKYFNKVKDFDVKTDAGIVTMADKESEQVISDFFAKKTPSFSVLGEETGLSNNGESRWIVDPLDGTTNFFHGFPHFNVSIGLEIEKQIVVGVVYNPITEEIFHTEKGNGAYKNKKQIYVSGRKDLQQAMLGTGFAYQRDMTLDDSLELFRKFTPLTHGIRRPGAAALDLCYVACGIYDGFYEKTLNAWDVAAGSLLITEAGGKLSNYKGKEFSIYSGEIVASNELIHKQIIDVINS